MHRSRFFRCFAPALAVLLLPFTEPRAATPTVATPARGGVPLTASAPDPGDPPGVTRFEPTRQAPRKTFAAALHDLQESHREALAGLRAQLAEASPARRDELQRAIEAEKLGFRARLMGAQLDRARAEGRGEAALALQQRLEALRPAMARLGVNEGGAR